MFQNSKNRNLDKIYCLAVVVVERPLLPAILPVAVVSTVRPADTVPPPAEAPTSTTKVPAASTGNRRIRQRRCPPAVRAVVTVGTTVVVTITWILRGCNTTVLAAVAAGARIHHRRRTIIEMSGMFIGKLIQDVLEHPY